MKKMFSVFCAFCLVIGVFSGAIAQQKAAPVVTHTVEIEMEADPETIYVGETSIITVIFNGPDHLFDIEKTDYVDYELLDEKHTVTLSFTGSEEGYFDVTYTVSSQKGASTWTGEQVITIKVVEPQEGNSGQGWGVGGTPPVPEHANPKGLPFQGETPGKGNSPVNNSEHDKFQDGDAEDTEDVASYEDDSDSGSNAGGQGKGRGR